MRHRHPVNERHHGQGRTLGERAADRVAGTIGSWRFLFVQGTVMTAWAVVNLVGIFRLHWDPYPFLLLNILLSTQAAFTGPILQLTSNRQAQKDRLTLEHASSEADKADEQNERILINIDQNTALTLAIVRHLGISATDTAAS